MDTPEGIKLVEIVGNRFCLEPEDGQKVYAVMATLKQVVEAAKSHFAIQQTIR